MTIHGSKPPNDITSLHSQYHHSLTDRRTITSRLNWPIRSIQRELNTINWRETTHFDSEDDYRTGTLLKRQSLSTTTVLLRTTFTRTIIFNLFMMTPGFKPFTVLESLCCLKINLSYLLCTEKHIDGAYTTMHFLSRRERRTRMVDSINIMAFHVQLYQIQDTSVNI